ncbi:PilZ domain-containing protein [Motiliproteus sediminis]|uniref:PilZ domain-containing protein n=1 Tax=Motiliproteus sediminis TaxID=1468178 RepID=UPI001AF01855|nr:PilZ domain-containing protein [Motiliproteus sediminis]
MISERRQHARIPVVWKATITRLNGEQLLGSTDNVSVDGINVILNRDLVLGEPVRVDVVTRCAAGVGCFRLQGVAVYVESLQHNLGVAVGLRLLDVDGRYSQLVQGLLGSRGANEVA